LQADDITVEELQETGQNLSILMGRAIEIRIEAERLMQRIDEL